MKEHTTVGRHPGRGMMALVAALVASTAVEAATTYTWKIAITPAGSGTVPYQVTSPAKAGVFLKSGSLTVAQNAYVDLTFLPATGYRLVSVTKDGDNWTPWLTAGHFQFGPVNDRHVLTMTCEQINPTGTFTLTFPTTLQQGPAPVSDLGGHYTGTLPQMNILPQGSRPRPYDFTATMDDGGKIDAIGTVDGIVPKQGATLHATGKVTTVKNVPTASLTVPIAATCEGVALSGSFALGGSAIPVDVDGTDTLKWLGTFTGKAGKLTVKGKKNMPVWIPAPLGMTSVWRLSVTLTEKMVPQGAKQVKVVTAQAALTLPDGAQIDFPERTVKYSMTSGYTLAFSKGTKHGTVVIDKTATVTLTKMMLTQAGANWSVTGGDITYAFLGQKGKGKLVDFAGP